MKKILVVGQTPPPFGGQAMMIRYMLDAKFSRLKLYHVRMFFSREFNDRGKFSLYKVTHLFTIIIRIWIVKFRYNISTLYYPLSSAPKIALLRDVIILGCTRFLFQEVVYHFHAAGISEELPNYPNGLRQLCYWVLKKPTLGITSSEHNPKDTSYLQSKRAEIIPLGIPDSNLSESRIFKKKENLTVMFMGLLNSTKGEGYILKAVKILNDSNRDVHFIFAGRFETEAYRCKFMNKVKEYGLEKKVDYRGVVSGEEKKEMFLEADVLCFPSFFSSESFGIVMLEGMMYQMPIIASRWRGVQSVVVDGENGFLVNIRNENEIANALFMLYDDREKLKSMGIKSRLMFKEKYELSKYIRNLENCLAL